MEFVIFEMKFGAIVTRYFDKLKASFGLIIVLTLTFLILSTIPNKAIALNDNEGEQLFLNHCAGCHINGGNIIRRNKTLKLKDLQRNSLDTPESIAKVAREGIGSMSGYEEVLGDKGDEVVANWVWNQSQNAWVHG